MLRLALALVLLLPMSTAMADITGKPRIVDGDTIHINQTKIRLHGIDAPETKQECYRVDGTPYRCGEAATDALRVLIGADPVRCEGGAYDRYKRLIAVCFTGGVDLNAKMVRRGWALAYRKYSTAYVAEEADAKANKLGLWRGQFVAPWNWRQGKRLRTEVQKTCCKICRKGKACGNSCIRRTYTCRKQPGCACDAK